MKISVNPYCVCGSVVFFSFLCLFFVLLALLLRTVASLEGAMTTSESKAIVHITISCFYLSFISFSPQPENTVRQKENGKIYLFLLFYLLSSVNFGYGSN